MKLTAITTNGLQHTTETEINKVSVWIGRDVNHKVTAASVEALVAKAQETNQVQAYVYGPLKGAVDAFEGTPLYSNGAETVSRLILDGAVIWEYKRGF